MTPTVITAVLLLSALSFVTTAIGVALALIVRASERAIAVGIGFAAGLMVLIALVELLPQSFRTLAPLPALLLAALGAGFVWLGHWIIPHTHLVDESGGVDITKLRSAYLVVFGLLLHDLPEGFAMTNAYVASPEMGVTTAIAIALHNLPEEFAMAVPMAALRRKRALFGAALLSGLAEPVGAAIGLAAVGIAPSLNSSFLALAAGAMLFVSVHELVPMARRYGRGALFAGGAALGAAVYAVLLWTTALLARAA